MAEPRPQHHSARGCTGTLLAQMALLDSLASASPLWPAPLALLVIVYLLVRVYGWISRAARRRELDAVCRRVRQETGASWNDVDDDVPTSFTEEDKARIFFALVTGGVPDAPCAGHSGRDCGAGGASARRGHALLGAPGAASLRSCPVRGLYNISIPLRSHALTALLPASSTAASTAALSTSFAKRCRRRARATSAGARGAR